MDLSNRLCNFLVKNNKSNSRINQTLWKYCFTFSLTLSLTSQCSGFRKLTNLRTKIKCWTISWNTEVAVGVLFCKEYCYIASASCSLAEQHISLQCWNLGDCAGPTEAPAGSSGVHPAHGALHRQNHGAGQELRAPDHCEKDLHQVSAALTGLVNLMCMLA